MDKGTDGQTRLITMGPLEETQEKQDKCTFDPRESNSLQQFCQSIHAIW